MGLKHHAAKDARKNKEKSPGVKRQNEEQHDGDVDEDEEEDEE